MLIYIYIRIILSLKCVRFSCITVYVSLWMNTEFLEMTDKLNAYASHRPQRPTTPADKSYIQRVSLVEQ